LYSRSLLDILIILPHYTVEISQFDHLKLKNKTHYHSFPLLTADNVALRGESAFADVPSGQWMGQSLADRIPSFSNHCGAQEQEEGSCA
jgi:hypothetical protein